MGQKVHPTGIRLGISKPWTSTWYANTGDYADNLYNDHQVRKYLTKQLKSASLSKIVIERPAKSIRVTIHTARPGVVIGKKGEDVEKLRAYVSKLAGVPAQINIAEVRKPELDGQLVADSISSQLERRVMAEQKLLVLNGTVKVAYLCTLSVQISITQLQKLQLPTVLLV